MDRRMEFFDSYCYGPADITDLRRENENLWLSLQDSAGRNATALYENCIYSQPETMHIGLHLSLVQQVSARQLLRQHSSAALQVLQLHAQNVAALLEHWEQEGFCFYLHTGSFTDLLVVAKNLDYQEEDERA